MKEILKPFGRYFLLDLLTEGGMAEIHRALMMTPQGASRLLVIKRIQRPYAASEDFHKMFWSEISLTMRFRHPNIVQLFDFGEEDGQPFLAMEYIQGVSLRALINKHIERGQPFPIDQAIYVISQAALGLHYAHSFTDELSGNKLNIVHRDISPQNLLVSYDGAVKVIDFGISKASNLEEITKTGMLKGKPCYMAPEYVLGGKIDRRYDIFALGVMLWELCTGKRLFVGPNDLAVLKMVQDSDQFVKAPSYVNLNLPEELDQVVMKALHSEPKKRYQHASELVRDLNKLQVLLFPTFEEAQFKKSIQQLLAPEIAAEKAELSGLLAKAEAWRTEQMLNPTVLSAEVPAAPSRPPLPQAQPRKPERASPPIELDIPSAPQIPIDDSPLTSGGVVPPGRRGHTRVELDQPDIQSRPRIVVVQRTSDLPIPQSTPKSHSGIWMSLAVILAATLTYQSGILKNLPLRNPFDGWDGSHSTVDRDPASEREAVQLTVPAPQVSTVPPPQGSLVASPRPPEPQANFHDHVPVVTPREEREVRQEVIRSIRPSTQTPSAQTASVVQRRVTPVVTAPVRNPAQSTVVVAPSAPIAPVPHSANAPDQSRKTFRPNSDVQPVSPDLFN